MKDRIWLDCLVWWMHTLITASLFLSKGLPLSYDIDRERWLLEEELSNIVVYYLPIDDRQFILHAAQL